jgi:hypothetical protein
MSLIKKLKTKLAGEPKGPAQKSGAKIDQAAGKAAAKVKTAVNKVGEKMIAAGKKLQK